MNGLKRSVFCGDLRSENIGEEVTVCGWVAKQRDLGALIFVDLRDKTGIVHAIVGKVSFDADKIKDNAKELITTLNKMKPTASKGLYMKSIFLSSSMSPSVQVDPKSV